jgi:hypothetical protein
MVQASSTYSPDALGSLRDSFALHLSATPARRLARQPPRYSAGSSMR